MSDAASALVQFHVVVKLENGRNCAVVVVGDIPEIFTYDFEDTDTFSRRENLQDKLIASFQEFQKREEAERRETDGVEYESDSSEDEKLTTPEKRGAERSEKRKVRDRHIQLEYLERMHVLLHEDPDGLGYKDLYATQDPIRVLSKRPGQKFRFAYLIWDLDTLSIISMERFAVPRHFTVPADPNGLYKIFSGNFNERFDERVDHIDEEVVGRCEHAAVATTLNYNPYEYDDFMEEIRIGNCVQDTCARHVPALTPKYVYLDSDGDDEF